MQIKMYDLPKNKRMSGARCQTPFACKSGLELTRPIKQGAKLYRGLLAQTGDYDKYITEMRKVISAMTESLNSQGRLCIFAPKHRVVGTDAPNLNTVEDLANCARDMGLVWCDAAYVSRGRQQLADAARRNIEAKRARRPMSDVCVLNIFEKP